MKHIFIFFITLYQHLSPFRGSCRFYPTCSSYTKEALREHGLLKGLTLGMGRILRCNPFGGSGIDFARAGS